MTTSAKSEVNNTLTIHPATRPGYVHYTAANLDRQIAFYQGVLGFKLHWREGESAGLGAGREDLLRLTELQGARRARGTTGLYHTAFLVPTRPELAQLLKRIAETRTPIQGMTDHGTHHAIYLPDAEGNGIELAWDFPKDRWPKTIEEMMRRNRGLAPEEVFSALAGSEAAWEGLAPETRVGHVHLHVSELGPTKRFYHEILGFEIPFQLDSALFFAAGDYHHHIGTNVWQGIGAPPPPADAIGLRSFTLVLPDQAELERVVEHVREAGISGEEVEEGFLISDPSANHVLLKAQSGG
jgi:catechol 2,3-dioxygenase